MKSATRITASVIGIYAGLLGMVHGLYEMGQGNNAPSEVGINAVGAPCQVEAVWHACLPAMTVVPSFKVSGILAMSFSFFALLWSAVLLGRKQGGLGLILLSILMLMVGAGFIPPYGGLIAGIAATRIHTPLTWWRDHLSGRALDLLTSLWPWTLILYVGWSLGGWILGYFFAEVMLSLSFILFLLFDLVLPLLTIVTGFARDLRQEELVEKSKS